MRDVFLGLYFRRLRLAFSDVLKSQIDDFQAELVEL